MKYDRRSFLRYSAGIFGNAGVLSLITACRSNGPTIARPCPATRPGCRVLTTRNKPAITPEPHVWSATRELRPPENWSSMSPADFLSFTVWDIDEISVPIGSVSGCRESFVFFVAIPRGTEELLYLRQRTDGTWAGPFTTVHGLGSTNPSTFVYPIHKVSVARVGIELHVCGVTSTRDRSAFGPGRLLHAVRPNTQDLDPGYELRAWQGQWKDALDATGQNEHVVDVACAGVMNPTTGREDLHVCVVTNDGRLLHSLRDAATSTWSAFGDAGLQAGRASGFSKIDCAGHANQLYVVAITNTGEALYTIRGPSAWRPFEDVIAQAGAGTTGSDLPFQYHATDVSVAFCNGGLPGGGWRLYILASGWMHGPRRLGYTIRSSEPVAWPQLPGGGSSILKPWATLLDETGGGGEGGEFSFDNSCCSVAECELR